MPIRSPQLDDLRYDAVIQQLLRRIPVYAPEWTDHNASDPGITLMQLFGWLAEMILYRLNQVPEKNFRKFLELIGVALRPPRPATAELAFTVTTKAVTAISAMAIRCGRRRAAASP